MHAPDVIAGVRHRGLDTLAWRLFVAGLCLHLLLSAHALLRLGYPYEAPLFGPFPFKIHPGTYLVLLSLIAALAARGHPIRGAFRVAVREPLLAVHLAVMVTCLVWVIWRHGTSGAAFIVDTHWLPAFAALALMHFDDRRRAWLLRLLAVMIAANAAIALVEYATQNRMWPLYLQGQSSGFADEEHFRSSAMLGHPLANAKVTAMLLPIALMLPMRGLWRWGHVGLLLLSMFAFGGRASLALAIVIYGTYGVLVLLGNVVRGRYSYLQLTGGSVLLLLSLGGLVAVVIASGLGERIFASLYLDNSASVRLKVWFAYEYLSLEQLWFGISAREIDLVALRLGLDPTYEAIENGWIYLSMQFGLVVFAFWVLGFLALLLWLARKGPGLAVAGVLLYVATASTSNSFASKTVTQGLMVTYVVAAAAQRRVHRAAQSHIAQDGSLRGRRQRQESGTGGGVLPLRSGPTAGRPQGRAVPWPRPAASP